MLRDFSYWEQDAFGAPWDVCILGGGITGLSTGISILEKRPGLRLVVVDRGYLPIGASTRNAGFACFGSPSEVLEDIGKHGETKALELVRDRYRGLRKLLARVPAEAMDYRPCGGYEVFHGGSGEAVVEKLPYLNQLVGEATGLTSVYRVVDMPAGLQGFDLALFNPYEGQLHPARMIQALRTKLEHLGGRLWTGPEAVEIEEENDRAILHFHLMIPLRARQLVVTTNAFAARLLPQLQVHGARNHVLVTRPVRGLKLDGTFHHDRGYVYFRNIGDRILLGGARNRDLEAENTDAFGSNPHITEALDQFLHRHLGADPKDLVEYRWSGIIGVGPDKSPIVTRISPHVTAGVRLSGMGVALASLIGERLADEVLQHLTGANR